MEKAKVRRATVLHLVCPGWVALLLLTQSATAAPEETAVRTACVAEETCTLVNRISAADGVDAVTLLDRSTARIVPGQAFAQWLPWGHAPAEVRTRVWHGGALHVERPTEVGTFLLRAVPGVRPAEEPEALLVLVTLDPLRTGTAADLPEPVAIARERGLLTAEQEARASQEAQAQRARTKSLVEAWKAYSRTPTSRTARNKWVDALGGDASALDVDTFLTPEQRTALRRAGLALEGRILLEDGPGPGVAYRLRVEAVPLEEVAREWNAGLRALVNPLERVPRPLLLVAPASRHEEVSFVLDVKDGDEGRMSQVVRRLLAVPGLSTDGKQLPPPGL